MRRDPEITFMFEGERSDLPSEKLPFGSVARLYGVDIREGEIVQLGGSSTLLTIPDAEGGSIWLTEFVGMLIAFYIKDDGGVRKQFVSVVNTGGSITDIASYEELRAPSIATAPERLHVTFGNTVHTFDPDGAGSITLQADIAGSDDTTAIDFGANRVYFVSGVTCGFSDLKAGGKCTTFNAGDDYTEAGLFDAETTQNYTNIKYINGRIAVFSPGSIEVKTLEKEDFADGSGSTVPLKKLTNYGKKKGMGTRTFLSLPEYDSKAYFIDESSMELFRMTPEKDTNNEIIVEPVNINKRNFETDFNFEFWTGAYSTQLKRILFAFQQKTSSVNDIVVLFDPQTGNFSRKLWGINNFIEQDNGDVLFASSNAPSIQKYLPDSIYDDDVIQPLVIEFNKWSDVQFYRKQRWKKLAFWFLMSSTTTITAEQSLNGSDYAAIKLVLDLPNIVGKFATSFIVLGRGVMGMPSIETIDKLLNVVLGKLRVRAKGTTFQVRLTINADEKFRLKDIALPDSRIGSARKQEAFQK